MRLATRSVVATKREERKRAARKSRPKKVLDTAENHKQYIASIKSVNLQSAEGRAGSGRLEPLGLQAAFHSSQLCPVPPLEALPETQLNGTRLL